VTTAGAGLCWGENLTGELGNGTTRRPTASPTPVLGGLSFASIDAGSYSSCGVTRSGEIWCWGQNALGDLGDGTTDARSTPVLVIQPPGS